ncbi:MAG TPA: Rieske 2Fe-2S domain-containing protein [Thermoleophilaceae bacterium]|nr:Rieske 2Fe-2S domain-containing protein [Thermoleophilaceae bacterium]
MRRIWRPIVALFVLLVGRRRSRREEREQERIIPPGQAARGAELIVAALLLVAALFAVGFIVVYALDRFTGQHELLGIALGLCFAAIAAAFVIAAKRLFVTEQIDEDYPEPGTPDEQEKVVRLLEESATPITRKKLIAAAGGAAGGALLAAAAVPALSLGPWLDTAPLARTPWRAGRRLVDDRGRPLRAADIETETFYTAYPEGASKDEVASPLVLVRLPEASLRLPRERADWAPGGILAYSKICTHAGCAISLYQKPTFPPTEPRPALICPCHYSTFDPARAAKVTFGPAGRPLPQLPLAIDAAGELRAGGNLSGPVGPAWSGVRDRKASS